MDEAASLSKMGVTYGSPKIDIDAVRDHKNRIVKQLNTGIAQMAKARKVQTLHGLASFVSNDEIKVVNEDEEVSVSFDKCIIASGSSSAMIPGIDASNPSILTSRTALDLKDIPDDLLVIGGGVIGLELGQVYATLGSNVSVVEFFPELVPGADKDILRPLVLKLKKQFKSIMTSSKVVEVKPQKDGKLNVVIESNGKKEDHVFDKALVSIGRKPNTSMLNIESTSINVSDSGFIGVDVYQRTNVENIFAIGDICGNPMLAHRATHQGKVAAEVACGHAAAFDVCAIPSVIYTDPEVAWAGLTEKEAIEKEIPFKKSEFPWAASGRAIAIGANQGKTKILFDPDTKQILGVAVVGPGAGDIISEGMLAMEMGSDAEDVSLTVHPHPTLGETFGMAAEVFEGTVTDLYIPKK